MNGDLLYLKLVFFYFIDGRWYSCGEEAIDFILRIRESLSGSVKNVKVKRCRGKKDTFVLKLHRYEDGLRGGTRNC